MSETVRETIKRVYDEACNYYQLFEEESDRGAAVLAHALFEHRLSQAIKSRDEKAFNKDLRFWVNIRIAYSLGLFDQETLDALDDINKIRNKFAHLPEPLTFKHELIAALCSKLTLKTTPTPDDFRERYLSYLREVDLTIKHKPIGWFLRAADNGIFFKGARSGVAATAADNLPSDTD